MFANNFFLFMRHRCFVVGNLQRKEDEAFYGVSKELIRINYFRLAHIVVHIKLLRAEAHYF